MCVCVAECRTLPREQECVRECVVCAFSHRPSGGFLFVLSCAVSFHCVATQRRLAVDNNNSSNSSSSGGGGGGGAVLKRALFKDEEDLNENEGKPDTSQ